MVRNAVTGVGDDGDDKDPCAKHLLSSRHFLFTVSFHLQSNAISEKRRSRLKKLT